MRENTVKNKLGKGESVLGAWLITCHPDVAEIMALAGYDFLIVDAEHTPVSVDGIQSIVRAISNTSCMPMVRVSWNDAVVIKPILDTGVEGIMIPMVNNAEQARAAVAACKYPPEGIRGMGTARAHGYGKWQGDYYAKANENILVSIQIEHIDAVRNIEEIISVPGIDSIFIGRNDLAASMGLVGGDNLPEVWAEVEKVITAARNKNMPAGMYVPKVSEAPSRIKEGYTFLTIGADNGILLERCTSICEEFKNMLKELK